MDYKSQIQTQFLGGLPPPPSAGPRGTAALQNAAKFWPSDDILPPLFFDLFSDAPLERPWTPQMQEML